VSTESGALIAVARSMGGGAARHTLALTVGVRPAPGARHVEEALRCVEVAVDR
jgi:hypothetical protein